VPGVLIVRAVCCVTRMPRLSNVGGVVRVLVMVPSMTRWRAGHRMAHGPVISAKLRVLRVTRLRGLLSRSIVIMMVSRARPVMMATFVCSAMLMPVVLHIAVTLPALVSAALPILPQGLYTESAVMASITSRPPTA